MTSMSRQLSKLPFASRDIIGPDDTIDRPDVCDLRALSTTVHVFYRNIEIYHVMWCSMGECGAGKSSLINLIMGADVAKTSPDAFGCTAAHHPYPVTINDQRFMLWDTAGLNEGSEGTVPASKAKKALSDFVRALNRTDGVHLLVYCIRGTRAAVALKNHKIFLSAVCDSQVPVVLVVTCLEDFRPVMASWWDKNEVKLKQYGLQFSGYACVTTLKDDPVVDPDLVRRRAQSYEDVRELILARCSQIPHKRWGTTFRDEGSRVRVLMRRLARMMRLGGRTS